MARYRLGYRPIAGRDEPGAKRGGTERRSRGTGDVRSGSDPLTDVRVTALDAFESLVVLGDAARLAERNARTAGLDAEAVRGDATRLPVRSGSQDVVTACRVLGDRSRTDAEATVREARRVLAVGGQFGVLECPSTHGTTDDPLGHWEAMLEEGGFVIEASGEVSRGGSRYCYVVGTASDPAA